MKDPKNVQEAAISVTRWVGSPASITVHTVIFLASFAAAFLQVIDFDRMLLILTTIVSLEAIYLAIFIQMTINYQAQDIAEVQEDVEEIQEDVGEIQEDVEELQEDIEEISEDVEEMSEDDDDEVAEERRKVEQKQTLDDIDANLKRLVEDIERLKSSRAQEGTGVLL